MKRLAECAVDGCDLAATKREWCGPHYKRWNRYGDPTAGGARRIRGRRCSIDGCSDPHEALGFCRRHYRRFHDFTCQICGKRGVRLNADHIKPWALYPELRFSIENGRTLCLPCHRATPTYGSKTRRTASR